MKRYDAHVHMFSRNPDPSAFLAALDRAGLHGAAVFSCPPVEYDVEQGVGAARLQALLAFTGVSDRLLPVLWVHPFEKDAAGLVREAAARGVVAFKMICNNYHVYEAASMELLRTIAALGKPAMFHSGILWDNAPSSQYNRPLDFEYLINIPGLRFSLAHCSWPWYDECIALYGKFLTVGQQRGPEQSAEMFFDLTPGTPAIYRRDLLAKLLTVGYDTTHNILFGTDCNTESYNDAWAAEWMERDGGIYKELGMGEGLERKIYEANPLRFFGLSGEKVRHGKLSMDGR